MSVTDALKRGTGERDAMEAAEDAREEKWHHPSFCGELFAGNLNFGLIYPFPSQSAEDKQIGDEHVKNVLEFLIKHHDADSLGKTRTISQPVLDGLAKLGCFGIKIPKKYGGLGLSQTNYNRIIHAVSSYCASTAVLLSAHQSIGVPQPLKMFGTEEQKQKWLPRLAKGEISAFALTEDVVGSDPAQMQTTAVPTADGNHYIINGEKLWTTNGPIAKLLVVMVVTPPVTMPDGREKKQISAFIVETDAPGFSVAHRCSFMGLDGVHNGKVVFDNVKVPKEHLLWGLGKGLKLALITLNTGRLTLPASCTGTSRACLQISRTWAKDRIQWGTAIGNHELNSERLLHMAGITYTMDAMNKLCSGLADKGESDLRIEASLSKLFTTGLGWRVVDQALQLRGGRGYETAESLRNRGDDAYPIERMMRDYRINTIIEGTSSIQRLFSAREALDRHLKLAGDLFNPKATFAKKLTAFFKAAGFYAFWYPKQWLSWSLWPKYIWAGGWEGSVLRQIASLSHRVARKVFHAMVLNGPKLERRQVLLGNIVDSVMDLFALSALMSYYLTRKKAGQLEPHETTIAKWSALALLSDSNRNVRRGKIWPGKSPYASFSKSLMDGKLSWLEQDIANVVGLSKLHESHTTRSP